jgi:hypothetical protein
MDFTLEEIEIMKRAVKDYELLEKNINERVKQGATIEDLLYIIRHLVCCDITNCDLTSDFKYIDFNYYDMTCSIVEDKTQNIPLHLSKSVELWNDKENYMFADYETIDNIIKIIKERG